MTRTGRSPRVAPSRRDRQAIELLDRIDSNSLRRDDNTTIYKVNVSRSTAITRSPLVDVARPTILSEASEIGNLGYRLDVLEYQSRSLTLALPSIWVVRNLYRDGQSRKIDVDTFDQCIVQFNAIRRANDNDLTPLASFDSE